MVTQAEYWGCHNLCSGWEWLTSFGRCGARKQRCLNALHQDDPRPDPPQPDPNDPNGNDPNDPKGPNMLLVGGIICALVIGGIAYYYYQKE